MGHSKASVRKRKKKAGYTATPVACGWAGTVFELREHLGKSSDAKDSKNIKEVKWGPTDERKGRTKRTDERKGRGVKSCSTRPKISTAHEN